MITTGVQPQSILLINSAANGNYTIFEFKKGMQSSRDNLYHD